MVYNKKKLGCMAVAAMFMVGCSAPTDDDDPCLQAGVPTIDIELVKGGSSGGSSAGASAGRSSSPSSSASSSRSSSSSAGKASSTASSKPHGKYSKSNGYYTPYIGSDGSEGYWNDEDSWVECEDDGNGKKKSKR